MGSEELDLAQAPNLVTGLCATASVPPAHPPGKQVLASLADSSSRVTD